MEREEYFQALRETSNLVNPILIGHLKSGEFEEPVKTFVEKLPIRRSKNPRLRDSLLRLSYQIAEGKNWQEVIPPYASAIELYNNSTYVINWFLDGKGEIQTKDDERDVVNAGFLLRELAQKVIQEQDSSNPKKTLEIIAGLSDVNSSIYRGQNLDLNILTVDNFKDYEDQQEFLEKLYEKGKLACGYFSKWITDTGCTLAEGDNDKRRILGDFAIDLSSGIQLANDAGDFVPSCPTVKTPDKSYKDQVTDIANGRLTLTTWYCLKHGTESQKRILLNLVGKRNVTLDEQEEVVYALRDSGAFNFVLSEADRIMNRCKRILHQLPESYERDLLSTMASLVRTNKFYVTLRERYGVK
jgi:geranylgeranyl pyrophosphate synthase